MKEFISSRPLDRVCNLVAGTGHGSRMTELRAGAPVGVTASRRNREGDLADPLRRSGGGDEETFAALYHATGSSPYGPAVRAIDSPELAAEVVQEVPLTVRQQAARFDPARASVVAWLCTVALRRAVDRVRQVQDREQTSENGRAEEPPDESRQEVEQATDTQQARHGLDAHTPRQREAVSRACHERGTYREVAQRLGVLVGTAGAGIRNDPRRLGTALGVQP